MTNLFVITPESSAKLINEIMEGLLNSRFQKNRKSYVKVDVNIIEQDQHFVVQITKFSSGYPNLKFMLTDALKDILKCYTLEDRTVVAIVEKKSSNIFETQKVICTRNTSLSLIRDSDRQIPKEFSLLKRYVSIMPLFRVEISCFDTFSSVMLAYILQLEQLDPNIKFSFRKNKEYVYRNHVKTDDIVLSCMLLSNYCATIFQNSKDDNFRKEIMDFLDIKKQNVLEETVGCLLLAQVDSNFVKPNNDEQQQQQQQQQQQDKVNQENN